jgi:hypothetical protein
MGCPLAVATAMPEAGHHDSIKTIILDLVTLPVTPAGLNLVRPRS